MSRTLLRLYDARDYMADVALRDEGLACKAGCSACCHHAVAVTLSDARILAKRLLPDDTERLRNLWVEQCERFLATGWRRYKSPCSLLTSSGLCSMYNDRPWPCRVYNSKDASACERVDEVESVRPPWDRMFARLVQIATTQDAAFVRMSQDTTTQDARQELTEQSVAAANRHYLMPAALLHLKLRHWGEDGIPRVFEYTPGPSQDKWERSLCKS